VDSPTTIVLIEDNPGDQRLIVEMLADVRTNARVEGFERMSTAVERLAREEADIVLVDLGLPDCEGLDTFLRLKDAAKDAAIIVLSGNVDTALALSAVEAGAQDFLVKGHFDADLLARSISYAIGRKAAESALRDSNAHLERMVFEVAESMGRVVEARDPYTQGHQVRVSALCKLFAEDMGLSQDETTGIEMAALVHDIGKLAVPAEILTRPGKLTTMEFSLVKDHPQQSYEILKGISFPWPVAEIALQHHERMDGSGYPSGLVGEEIILPARILAVADVVEAMASHRPYRPALGVDAAIKELRDFPERYDPAVVAACMSVHDAGLIEL
jgi:HD-GYP domain-containing protein (c-di-GMP phosphodiesterase class II)